MALASLLFFRGERVLLWHELRGVDEQPVMALRDVVSPEIHAVLVALGALQVGDEPAVR